MKPMNPTSFTISKEDIITAGRAIKAAKRVAVISPKNLDGDSLGSCSALYLLMKQLGKESILMCLADIPDNLKCIPRTESYVKELNVDDWDLFIVPDTADPKLTGMLESHPDLFNGKKEVINLDHHVTNTRWGTINLIDPECASATMAVYRLMRSWNVKPTSDMATAMMTGLYTDTGSFMHSNTTPLAYEIGAKLLSLGADLPKISKTVFRTTTVPTMKLWGRVLSRAVQNKARVTVSYILQQDFDELGQNPDHLSGVVDYINAVPDNRFSALISEYNGRVKASLRALRDDVDLTKIAGIFGGGGHPKASGFSLPGRLVIGDA